MCDRGCCFSLGFLQHRQGRSPDATDQPVLEQGQSVIDKQPQPEILSMGNGHNKMNKQNKGNLLFQIMVHYIVGFYQFSLYWKQYNLTLSFSHSRCYRPA